MRNKNKLITLLFAFVFTFGIFASAFAVTDNSAAPKNTKSQGTDDIRQNRVMESRREAVKKLMNNQINLATRSLNRLSGILVRIETRTEKLEAKGADVSALNDLIETAKTKQEEAKELLEAAKDDLEAIGTSTTPKAVAQDFIKQSRELKKKLIELHKAMLNAVQEIKKLEQAQKAAEQAESGEQENE